MKIVRSEQHLLYASYDPQSKTVGEILPLRNKQAGQLMGYGHNTGQNKTIVNVTSDTLAASVCAAVVAGVDTSEETAGGV